MRRGAILLLIAGAFGLGGCATGVVVAEARPELDQLTHLALVGLDDHEEAIFIGHYMHLFPKQTFVERRLIEDVLREQDTLPDRLDQAERERLRKLLGADGIIIAHWEGDERLRIRIVRVDTGEIAASAVVDARATALGGTVDRETVIWRAVVAIRDRLLEVTGSPGADRDRSLRA